MSPNTPGCRLEEDGYSAEKNRLLEEVKEPIQYSASQKKLKAVGKKSSIVLRIPGDPKSNLGLNLIRIFYILSILVF